MATVEPAVTDASAPNTMPRCAGDKRLPIQREVMEATRKALKTPLGIARTVARTALFARRWYAALETRADKVAEIVVSVRRLAGADAFGRQNVLGLFSRFDVVRGPL